MTCMIHWSTHHTVNTATLGVVGFSVILNSQNRAFCSSIITCSLSNCQSHPYYQIVSAEDDPMTSYFLLYPQLSAHSLEQIHFL